MWKETLHLKGLSYLLVSLSFALPIYSLVSLSFALPIYSSSVINSEILDGSEAPIWAPRPQAGARLRQENITLIFVAGVTIGLAIFIATYCIAYRTMVVRQDLYRSRARGTILEGQNDGEEEGMNSNGGLEASLVSSLPIVQYSAGMFKEGNRRVKGPHEEEQNVIILWVKDCAVCLSEYEEGEEMKVLPECGHCFHTACINMWLFSHSTCPICRLPLLKHIHAAHPAMDAISQNRSGPPRGLHVAVDM